MVSKSERRTVRKRRSPEEARAEILSAAQARLREFGVGGLNVADVASDCGMSHATVIHHFGSTSGMRTALVEHMTDVLLRDVIIALQQSDTPNPPEILRQLFAALSEGGHARLLAWLAVSGDEFSQEAPHSEQVANLFAELVPVLASRIPEHLDQKATAKRIIFLTATAALGYGIGGEPLAAVMGVSAEEAQEFPAWLGELLYPLLEG